MGLAVEEKWGKDGKYRGCKVYVGNSPDLLVLEDTDGDDKADRRLRPPDRIRRGSTPDHGVHGMVLGTLDGKLSYFTHGDGCCSYEQDLSHTDPELRRHRQVGAARLLGPELANTLRGVNRDGTQFEIIADRQPEQLRDGQRLARPQLHVRQ